MPATAEKCVKVCIQKIKETFDGFGEEAVDEFYKIMIDEVRNFGETVRKESMAAAAVGGAAAEPEKPRLRRVNNYTLFGTSFRKEHPEIKEDMFKRIAEAWKALSDKVKEEWKAKADAENSRLKEDYVKEHGEPPKKRKSKNRPKTTNPFQEYVKEFRSKNPKVGHKEVFREASKAWKKLNEKQKKKYQDTALSLRDEYKAAWEEEQKNNPQPAEDVVAEKSKKREQKPRPKTRSGYILFGNHWREKLNTNKLNGKEAMSALAAAWGALSDKEKAKYGTDAEKDNKKIIDAFVKEFPDSEWARKHTSTEVATA